MRYNGTLKVELSDGTVEKFKDEEQAFKERWDNPRRWTHTMEKQYDDSLVVTRHIEQVHWGDVEDSWTEVVGHYPPGSWLRARFKD